MRIISSLTRHRVAWRNRSRSRDYSTQ